MKGNNLPLGSSFNKNPNQSISGLFSSLNQNNASSDVKIENSDKEPKVTFNNPILSIFNLNNSHQPNKENPDQNMPPSNNNNQGSSNPSNLNINLNSINPNLLNNYQICQNLSFNNYNFQNLLQLNNIKGSSHIDEKQVFINNLNSMNEAIFQKNLYDYFITYSKNLNNQNIDWQNKIANYLKERKMHSEYLLGQFKNSMDKGVNYLNVGGSMGNNFTFGNMAGIGGNVGNNLGVFNNFQDKLPPYFGLNDIKVKGFVILDKED